MDNKANAKWMPIDWKDLYKQIGLKVSSMRNLWIDMTRDKLCEKAGLSYAWILVASRRNTMRIKTVNKLKKVWINVVILV